MSRGKGLGDQRSDSWEKTVGAALVVADEHGVDVERGRRKRGIVGSRWMEGVQ